MAKKSAVERNLKRTLLVKKFASKRAALMVVAKDTSLTPEERFNARLKLAEIPRNSAAVRLRLRCELTGRPRSNYRKFNILKHILHILKILIYLYKAVYEIS